MPWIPTEDLMTENPSPDPADVDVADVDGVPLDEVRVVFDDDVDYTPEEDD